MFDVIQFSSLGEFLNMGGYAFNVWAVYALFVVFFSVNLYYPLMQKKSHLDPKNDDNKEVENLATHVGGEDV